MAPLHDTIVVLDYGSQTAQLIARRVRELQVYCELLPWDSPAERVLALQPKGFILSGGPASVYEPGAPVLLPYVLASGLPVLGICYGMHLLARALGGSVEAAQRREYGHAELQLLASESPLLSGLPDPLPVWMSHGDHVSALPSGAQPLARSLGGSDTLAALGDVDRSIYGVQFHPEVQHTPQGRDLLSNFALRVCRCTPDWTPASFVQ
jgi:GMP synthase (glutamine-hydrolysing)